MSQSYTPASSSLSSSYISPSRSSAQFSHAPSSPLEYIAHSAISYSSHHEPTSYANNISPSGSSLSSYLHLSFSHPSSSTFSPSSSPSKYSYSPKLQSYSKNQTHYQHLRTHQEYHFAPATFLKPGKHSIFVGDAEQIRSYVEETFSLLFNSPLPENIKISICTESEFRKIAPHPSTIGLSLNRGEHGLLSEIFVLNDTLPRVLLTLGHELGHVLTKTLDNAHNEEAKAYAFSLAWMNTIKEHNIANLADCIITESPAQNGLHNIAFDLVARLLKQGQDAWRIYHELISKMITLSPQTDFYSFGSSPILNH